jgi:integrase
MTVDGWVTEFARSSTGRSPETLAHTLGMVRGFQVAFERTELAEVSRLDARRWCAEHPSSARYVRLLFAEAVRAGLVTENPFERPGSAPKPLREVKPPSPSELDRICSEASPCSRLFIRVAAGTGLRLSEIAALEPRDVQQVPLFRVRVRNGKGGKQRVVGAFGDAREILLDRCSMVVAGRLLRTPTGREWTRHSVGEAWRKAARAAGYPGSFHKTRHYFASWALSAGVSEVDLAIQLGHTDREGRANTDLIRRVYGRPDPERCLERLDERLGA